MIRFPSTLVSGRLVQRYKRFFADVELSDGQVVTAHCANTGTLRTCGEPGDQVYLLHQPSPKRKLAYTWELTKVADGFVGVNTARPNHVVAAAVQAGAIAELAGYATLRSEVKYGEASRIDLLLEGPGRPPCYVEVKNTTLLAGRTVQFPDAVTSRGLKHVHELVKMRQQGARAVMFFFVNRPEGEAFALADEIDPTYARALRAAQKQGVGVLAYRAEHSLDGITLGEAVAVEL